MAVTDCVGLVAGLGDADVHLHEVDPVPLTDFIRSTQDSGATVVLLHCWPFHRHAAYLAQVYDHVSVDIFRPE